MTSRLRIAFAGTPEFAAHNLLSLLQSEHDVCAVFTQPDRPAGRGRKVRPSAVKELAQEKGLAVYQPLNFKDEHDIDQLKALNLDLLVVIAYGIILPQQVLDIPKLGCINVHASLLPRWRGAAPIERALLSGDSLSGVTIMQMDKGLDTGDMLCKSEISILPEMTSFDLYQALLPLGAAALVDTLDAIANGSSTSTKQDNALACYAEKLNKEEAAIDWSHPADQILRKIKGMSPRPVAHSQLDDASIRVWNARLGNVLPQDTLAGTIVDTDQSGIEVCCGDQRSVILTELQLPGAKRLNASQVLNAKQAMFATGAVFTNTCK